MGADSLKALQASWHDFAGKDCLAVQPEKIIWRGSRENLAVVPPESWSALPAKIKSAFG